MAPISPEEEEEDDDAVAEAAAVAAAMVAATAAADLEEARQTAEDEAEDEGVGGEELERPITDLDPDQPVFEAADNVDDAIGVADELPPGQERPETTGLSRPSSHVSRKSSAGGRRSSAGVDDYDQDYHAAAASRPQTARLGGTGSRTGSSAGLPPIETPGEDAAAAPEIEKLQIPADHEDEPASSDAVNAVEETAAAAATDSPPASLPASSLPSPPDHRTTPEGDSHADEDEAQQQQRILQQQQQQGDDSQQQQPPEVEKMALSNGFVADGHFAVVA